MEQQAKQQNSVPTSWAELAEYNARKIEIGIVSQSRGVQRWWNHEKFVKWFMRREGVGWRFDFQLIFRAYIIWRELNRQGDHFTVISGDEGSGKSTLAIQLNSWVSPYTFRLPYVNYSGSQFLKKLKEIADNFDNTRKKEKKSALLDEGGMDLFARESFRSTNVWLNKTFFAQRFLGVHTVVCIPNFFMLDAGVREHRVKTLIHVTRRGFYHCITGKEDGIMIANQLGAEYRKRLARIPVPKGFYFDGKFSAEFPHTINKKEYEKNKLFNIRSFLDSAIKGIKEDKRGREF